MISADGFGGGGPEGVGTGVADVEEAAPGVERGVGAPAGEIEIIPAAIAAAGVGDHERVAAVAVKVDAGDGGGFFPDAFGGLLGRGGADLGGDGGFLFERGVGEGDALEQDGFDGADAEVGVEAALHDAAVKSVVESGQAHALVVRHIAVDHDAALALRSAARVKSMAS